MPVRVFDGNAIRLAMLCDREEPPHPPPCKGSRHIEDCSRILVTSLPIRIPRSSDCNPPRRIEAEAMRVCDRGSTCQRSHLNHCTTKARGSLHLVVLRETAQVAVLHLLQIVHLPPHTLVSRSSTGQSFSFTSVCLIQSRIGVPWPF